MLKSFLLLGLAGACGTWARVGLTRGLTTWTSWSFPVGTLTANVLGSFLFGCAWAAAEQRAWLDESTRVLICLGFLGAFTTFSTFAYDNGVALRSGEWGSLALNLALNNILGLCAVLAGWHLLSPRGAVID